MRTAKYLTGAALLILSLAPCVSTPAFNGSRTGNDEQFLLELSLIHISEPTRRVGIAFAVVGV